jgi:hypothetical protein
MRPVPILALAAALAASVPSAAQGIAVAVSPGCSAPCPTIALPADSVTISALVQPSGSRTVVEHSIRNASGEPVDANFFLPVPADAQVGVIAVLDEVALLAYGNGDGPGPLADSVEAILHAHPHLPLRPLVGRRVVHVPLPEMASGATRRVQVIYSEPPRHQGARRVYTYPLAAAADAPFARLAVTVEVRTEHGFRGEIAAPSHPVRVRDGSEPGPCHPQARCGTTNRPSRRIREIRLAAGPEAAAADFRIEYLPLDADDPDAVDGPEPWPDAHHPS